MPPSNNAGGQIENIMENKTVVQIIEDMEMRFRSGNEVPVERAHLKREEWNIIRNALLSGNKTK